VVYDPVVMRRQLTRMARLAMPIRTDVHVTGRVIPGPVGAPDIPVRVYRQFGTGIGTDAEGRPGAIVYFHGGGWVTGDLDSHDSPCRLLAAASGCIVVAVGYRLAPEDPFPAPVDDAIAAYAALLDSGTAPSDVVFAGESAGGGLAIATLVNARDHELPQPAAAFVMSPYADLTLTGTTLETKGKADPLLSREALQARVADYTAGQDAALPLISPLFADLSGLPPLIIQAGTHEVLLDDALRLARRAATADVAVTLDVTPGVPHVFQAYHQILDEAAAALDRAGQFLSAQLAVADRVTG
jgi:acetyl esterase/lipase